MDSAMTDSILRPTKTAAEQPKTSLRQIQYFLAAAESGSFSAAARLVNVSQPSLCVQIKKLENGIGANLLTRHARGVELTAAGTAFLPHATAALDAINRAERAVADLGVSRAVEISLGVTPTAGRALVADLLHQCKENALAPRIQYREGLSDELWDLVAKGDLDASICYDPSDAATLQILPLYREDLFLIGAPNVLDTVDEPVSLAALGNFPLVLGYQHHRTRQFIENAARVAGADLRSVDEVEPITLKRELLVRHGRCSIIPYGLFLDEIKAGELIARPINPRLSRTVALLLNTSLPTSAVQFLQTAIEAIVKRRIAEGEIGWRMV